MSWQEENDEKSISLKENQVLERYSICIAKIKEMVSELPKDNLKVCRDYVMLLTVFSHASFEDFIREIILGRYQFGDGGWLDEIPISGRKHATKLSIKELYEIEENQGLSQVLKLSIHNYIKEISISSIASFDKWISRIGINTSNFERFYPILSKAIQARHDVVHRAGLDLE